MGETYRAWTVREEVADTGPVVEVKVEHGHDEDEQEGTENQRRAAGRQQALSTSQPRRRLQSTHEYDQDADTGTHRVDTAVERRDTAERAGGPVGDVAGSEEVDVLAGGATEQ